MRSRSVRTLALLLPLLLAAGSVRANDDLLIYSDQLNNGWGEWGWVPHYTTNNPVHSGSNCMVFAASGAWQAWWLKHDNIDTSLYTNLTLWVNGGPTGGQYVGIQAELGGSTGGLPRLSGTAPANGWAKLTFSLAALGVANKTNLTGLQMWNSGTLQPNFYLDDIALVANPAPATVQVSVNATQAIRTVDARVFGVNQVAWDGNLNTATTLSILNDLGNPCLRWPGGSWGDGYHWTNEYRGWGSYSSDFIKVASNTHAQAFIIVNYGSSSAEEAAYGVRMFNVTNRCGFKYWEVGNEVGGTWETDEIALFPGNAITNLSSFAAKLYTPANAIAQFVRTNLSTNTLVALTNYVTYHNNAATLQPLLIGDLNSTRILDRSSTYSASLFAGVTLRPETVANMAYSLPSFGQVFFNRMLLEDAFPTELARQPHNVLPDAFLPHDPWTYAQRFVDYYTQMKAVDNTIKIGAVADITEDGTSNYTNHPVVNPRTGVSHNGWTPVLLTYLRSNNIVPDFLIEHKYAPNAGDTTDLLWSKTWASDAASLRQMLTDYLGSAATNVTLECTENGGGGDRQRVSLVGGLFYADSIGQILQTEFNSRIWWDTRNGPSSIANSDPALYGWRTNASGAYIYDEGIVYNQGYTTNRYPTYYIAKLMPYFATGGDLVVRATTDYPLLAAYAVRRTNGSLSLLVINKSSFAALNASIAVSGYRPLPNAQLCSYGIPQDDAARTGSGSADLFQTNFPGAAASFAYTFPPYSATVLALAPVLPPTIGSVSLNAGVFTFTFPTQIGPTYSVEYKDDLSNSSWQTLGTWPGTGQSVTVTNTGAAQGRRFFRVRVQ